VKAEFFSQRLGFGGGDGYSRTYRTHFFKSVPGVFEFGRREKTDDSKTGRPGEGFHEGK
jgi:hypothetical protein